MWGGLGCMCFLCSKGVGWGVSSAPSATLSLSDTVCLFLSLSLLTWALIIRAGLHVGFALFTVQLPEMLHFFHGSKCPVVGTT